MGRHCLPDLMSHGGGASECAPAPVAERSDIHCWFFGGSRDRRCWTRGRGCRRLDQFLNRGSVQPILGDQLVVLEQGREDTGAFRVRGGFVVGGEGLDGDDVFFGGDRGDRRRGDRRGGRRGGREPEGPNNLCPHGQRLGEGGPPTRFAP